MKKLIVFVLITCTLTISNLNFGYGTCWGPVGQRNGICTATDDELAYDSWYIDPSGLDLNISFWASVPSSGSGYDAYAFASWNSTGPTSYYFYGVNSSNVPYYSDASPYVQAGNINLTAVSEGTGSGSSVYASW